MLRKIFLPVIGLCLLLSAGGLLAQNNEIILTVNVPQWREEVFESSDLFAQFEADHPGVKVVLSQVETEPFFPPAAFALEEHLDGAAEYANSADVLWVSSDNLSVETTRAGYFLDLTPLTASDPDANLGDFFPAALESMQWDRGLWGLPLIMDVTIIIYDPAAFDAAGLSYPNEGWTLADFANADRELTQVDDNGEVTQPGVVAFGAASMLIRSLLERGFYDPASIPQQPDFSDPQLEALLTELLQYRDEGLLGNSPSGQIDFNAIPLMISQPFALSDFQGTSSAPKAGVLLPGGHAGLRVEGFGVSSGTTQPEMAYELVKYLTNSPELVNGFFSTSPARRSLVGVEGDTEQPFFTPGYSEENQAIIDLAMESALPTAEMRFSAYIEQVLNQVESGEAPDLRTALDDAEIQATENLQEAAARQDTAIVIVATPVPTPVLGSGEVAINFGITSFISPLPNQSRWDDVIAEFTSTDPEVRQVTLDSEFGTSLTQMAEQFDCFYLPYNSTSADDINTVLNLDPFMDADLEFDESDMVGNIMQQVERDNRVWAYPLNLQPQALFYNTDVFAEAGVPAPEAGWSTSEFTDALRSLKIDPDDPAPFQPRDFGGNYILMLAAAFGGLPLDYELDPPGINFTDPATVDGLRQVLDLAKQGYIEYNELSNLGGGFISGSGGGGDVTPIYNQTLNELSFNQFQFNAESETQNSYRLTSYPAGSQYIPVTYSIGTTYISATAANPEACYRWITHLSNHPELFASMPARRSQIDNPELETVLGNDLSEFFHQFDLLLQSPNIVEFPSIFGSGNDSVGGFILQLWLNRALDSYVLEDGDLETELADAELYANDYLTCISGIPPFDPNEYETQVEQIRYFQQFTNCAVEVDPSLSDLFPAMLVGEAED